MRKFSTWFGASGVASARTGSRPEALRRQTLAVNAAILIGLSLVGMPVALYLLTRGMMLPFVLDVVALGIGFVSLALHRSGQYERAAAGQVYGTLLIGLLLAIADPAIADFGLATALLAPVHASLLTRKPVQRRSWAGLVVVVALAAAAMVGWLAWPEAHHPGYVLLAGTAFLATAVIVAHSANRLNSIFEVYDKAQINAYRHLIEHVQDAVLRFASDGTLLFASRSSEKLFGCRRYELSGNGLAERVHVMDRPAFLTALAAATADGKASTIEVRMRHDDEVRTSPRYTWVEVALSPVIDQDAPRGRYEAVGLLRDVTERRDQAEETDRARKLAEETSIAKSRFLATIGHELRTPLNAIVGFSEMMSSGVAGELSPTHREYASLIHKSGTHLIEVVNMLLDMSRIEAGRFELQTESFVPDALIEPCLQIVEPMACERKIRLVAQVPANLPHIIGDERACRQIIINLLSNAVKFSNSGDVVTLALKRQGQSLNISVTDKGIGMEQAEIDRIGEPFFQAHAGLARGYEGTGLGLSIVKGLVDLHDGTLHATSAPGEGTVMTVLLPINGPETKVEETGTVTPLREPNRQQMPEWHDERRKAQ